MKAPKQMSMEQMLPLGDLIRESLGMIIDLLIINRVLLQVRRGNRGPPNPFADPLEAPRARKMMT